MRWRVTLVAPANFGDTIIMRKWLSPVPGDERCPACSSLSFTMSRRVGSRAIMSFSRRRVSADIDLPLTNFVIDYWLAYVGGATAPICPAGLACLPLGEGSYLEL